MHAALAQLRGDRRLHERGGEVDAHVAQRSAGADDPVTRPVDAQQQGAPAQCAGSCVGAPHYGHHTFQGLCFRLTLRVAKQIVSS